MDLKSWEKVLLEWIHTFGFSKSDYITLEQTDIDSFFAYYVQKAQVEPVPVVEVALQAQPTQHLSPNEASSGKVTPLLAFLGGKSNSLERLIVKPKCFFIISLEMYPEFNGRIDGRGRLAGSDYLYVYSLLLHYKCVKQPSASFHSICKKLPVLAQSCICEFFQQTMNKQLTRENLSQAIADVSSAFLSPGAAEVKPCRATSSHSLDSDGSGHCSSLGEDTPDLPIDFIVAISSPSPKAMPPPATPKTELLEQRTREVRGLQAQLEAERYEKNVLEEQILENEHLIKSLRKENKVKKLQLAKLKDTSENEDEDSIRKYVPNEFDHLKCSLLKEISQKEAVITEIRDKLQDLRMENTELRSKVKSSTEQLVVCMDRIRDLEVRQEELSLEVSTKSEQVISLERDKQELEQCLQVTRDELHNRREVLNSSSDLLDLPMSPNTTPENLADSVIDKQLREKEHENLQLREELQELSKSLLVILEEHGLSVSDNSSQLSSSICIVKEELTKSVRLIELRDSQLLEKGQLLDQALAHSAKLIEQGREHAKELEEIRADYEQKLASHLSSQQVLQSQNDKLLQSLSHANDESAKADEHLRQIKLQLAEKEEQMTKLGSEISELREKNKTLESRTNSLITERNSGVLQLHQEQRRQKCVRNKYTQCREQLVAQSSDIGQLSSHLNASDWSETVRKVDELIAARDELQQQHEALKLDHVKTEQEAKELKERLQLGVELQQCVQQSHEQQQADLQEQLQVANEQMETMRQRNLQFVEKIQTDLNSQLDSYQQEVESFLSRITAVVNGSNVCVKSEYACQLSKFEQFESTLVSSLHQRSLEVTALRATADQLREQLETVQRQNDLMLEAESQQRASKIDQLMRLMQSLEASAAKLRATLVQKDAEIATRNRLVAELQEQLANDQASALLIKQLNDTIQNLEQVNEKLIDDNAKLQNLHMDISSSLLTANGEVERLTNELSSCQARITEMTASDKLKATQLSDSDKEQQKLQGQLNEMSAKYSELEQQVDHQRTLKSDCEKRCQELEEMLTAKESQFSQLNKQHEELLEGLKAKLKDAQYNIEQQRQAILTDRDEIHKYRGQLADLAKARDQTQEISKLRGLLSEGEKDNQEHLKTIQDLHAKEQQLTQKMDKLMGDHSAELSRLQAMLMDKQAITAQLKTQLASATELAQERAKLLTKAELAQVELAASLQSEKAMSEQMRAEAEERSAAAYERIGKLEKLRDSQEHKARLLSDQLAEAEQLKVSLNLEIGGLNSDIEQRKRQMADQANQLTAKQNIIAELECQLKSEVEEHKLVKAELEQITMKLAEVQQELNSTRLVHDKQHLEIGSLKSDIEQRKHQMAEQANKLKSKQNEIAELECRLKSEVEEHKQVKVELEEITVKLAEVQQELNSTRLVHDTQHFELDEKTREMECERAESAERVRFYQRRIESLEGQLAEVQAASQTQAQAHAPTDLCTTYSKADCPAVASDDELGQLRQEMARSKLDCQILQAKYRETKEEIQRCEQKIKDQRLEMEGKLDKMKTKMRSLYTAEVTRMKEKQERDAANNKAEVEALTAQNIKYEEHTRKLSNQIVRLNDKILEQQKQHAIISTKLRHLQMQPQPVTKAPASVPLATVNAGSLAANDDWQPFKRPTAPSSNLTMEDEEGEVFNNTYLTDLKLGRVPDITAEELNYRNSLQPPHLKSTYAAQYDLSSQDEDLKDGPHTLDDSMCALLSTTGTGTRKKSIGTHYKRPGPPTPSKNGGRLSFGSSEPPREVLRECNDHNSNAKTPARFKFLTTRFSVGSSGLPRDEVINPWHLPQLPQRKRSSILTRLQRRRLQRQAADAFCTSTPRKSRSYYDRQRLIDTVFSDEDKIEEADQQTTPHLSNGALLALTQGNTRRISAVAAAAAATHTPKRQARLPLYLNGNGTAKIGISGERMRQRRKMCRERMARFDQVRPLDQVRLSDRISCSGRPSQLLMGKTVVLDDGRGRRRSMIGVTFKVEDSLQLQVQQFEADNMSNWTPGNVDSEVEDCRFEQLCRQKASTAPFHVQP
ncbi:hypothetical protein KR054_009876, partial [Drosophila jambulina]